MSTDVQMNAFQERLAALEAEITQMTGSDVGTEGFFRFFLEQMVSVLAVGGGVWLNSQAGETTCICHLNLAAAGLDEQGAQYQLLLSALAKVSPISGRTSTWLTPGISYSIGFSAVMMR